MTSHLYDITTSGLGLVATDLGTVDTAIQIANYALSGVASNTGLKKIRDADIPALIDATLTGLNEDFDALNAFETAIRANEITAVAALSNALTASVTGLNNYFVKFESEKLRVYVNTTPGSTKACLVGASGATGTITASSGPVTAIAVTAGGTGFVVGSTLTVTPGTSGTGAVAKVATVSGADDMGVGALATITIVSGGSGYTNSDTCTISVVPVLPASFRFLYGRTQADDFIFPITSQTISGGVPGITGGTADNLDLYGPVAIIVTNGGSIIPAGTSYSIAFTGLIDATTGLAVSPSNATVVLGGAIATPAGAKVQLNIGKKYSCATALTSGGPSVSALSYVVTPTAVHNGDSFVVSTV